MSGESVPTWDGRPAQGIGVQMGACESMAHVAELKQTTHDMLIEQMGDARRGPIVWKIYTGDERAKALLVMLEDDDSDDAIDEGQRLAAYFTETPNGALVVAIAAGAEPGTADGVR